MKKRLTVPSAPILAVLAVSFIFVATIWVWAQTYPSLSTLQVTGNQFAAAVDSRFNGGTAISPQLSHFPVSQLPTEIDGQALYARDGLPGSYPCSGSSTGTIAIGIAGKWACLPTLSSGGSVPINTAPAQTADYSAHGFRLRNIGAAAAASDVLSEGNPIGLIMPPTATLAGLTVNGTSTLAGLNAGTSALTGLTVSGTSTLTGLNVSGTSTLGTLNAGTSTLAALTVNGTTMLNADTTVNSGTLSSTAYANQPDTQPAYTGGTINCQRTVHNYTLSANSILTLSCLTTGPDWAMVFNFFQPKTGSALTWTFAAAGTGSILWTGGTVPSACSTLGCADKVEADFVASQNTYLLTEIAANYQGTTGGGSPNCPAGQTCYYVAATGLDSNSGTTTSAPFLTVSKAASVLSTLNPGDRILFHGGDTWTAQTMTLGDTNAHAVTGTAAKPIIIGSYGTGQPIFDENNANQYCFNAINPANVVKYLTLDNFECKHATRQAVTFQTSQGGMPGIIVSNFYIHDTGQGCSSSNGSCLGTDTTYTFANQLDFEDSGFTGNNFNAVNNNGVQFLNNTVKWTGGHNCLEVDADTGSVVVSGNVVGPGCVHSSIDVRDAGTCGHQVIVQNNVCDGGQTGLTENGTCYYTENTWNSETNIRWSGNLAWDVMIGFQICPGAVPSGYTAGGAYQVYNNTFYASNQSLSSPNGSFGSPTCNGSNSGTQNTYNLNVSNNIFDGASGASSMIMAGSGGAYLPCFEDYNNIGGAQGNAGYGSCGGRTTLSTHDQNAVNPLYTSASTGNFHLQSGSPEINAGLAGLTSNPNIGAY